MASPEVQHALGGGSNLQAWTLPTPSLKLVDKQHEGAVFARSYVIEAIKRLLEPARTCSLSVYQL